MRSKSTRDHIAEYLEDISSGILKEKPKVEKTSNRRKQSDLSFIENACEDAEKYYIKLKNNERIPTFYLDLPCPQCGNRTIGHGQKHRVERKCRVCQLTFQLDTWLMHIFQSNTPLKYFIEKSIGTLFAPIEKPLGGGLYLSEEEALGSDSRVPTLSKIAHRQMHLEEAGNVLKRDMDDLAENLQIILSLYKELDKKLIRIKKDIELLHNEKNEQDSLQHRLNNEQNTIEKNSANSTNNSDSRIKQTSNA